MNTQSIKRAALALGILAVVAGILALAGVVAEGQDLAKTFQSADPKPYIGAWKGTLSIAGVDLEIGLNFKLDEAKKIAGTFDSITQGAFGLAIGNIEIMGKTVTFQIDNVPGEPTFKGTLDETGKKMTGEFTQGGAAGTFAVEKQ
jgi:hypothetical protein